MVIINETFGSNGRKLYELEELVSGTKTKWTPPRGMKQSECRDALILAAKRLEAQAEQRNCDFSIAPTPMMYRANAETPFGTYAAKVYMPRKIPTIAENTRDGWERYLRLRILPAFGAIPIGEITPDQLMDFFVMLQSEGLAYQTIDRYFTFLSGIFKMAKKTGIISVNPMTMVDKPSRRKDELINDTVDACTAEEIAHLLEIMEKEPLKWRIVVRLLIETGMRVGECTALCWSDIDWRNNAITIRSSLGYTSQKGVYVTTPKSRRSRVVYVSDDMMCLLLNHYIDNCAGCNSPYINHQVDNAEAMHPQSPGKYLKRLCQRYDLPHIHPHKLRHSYASIAITNGADVTSVADNLGHRDSSLTLWLYIGCPCEPEDAVRIWKQLLVQFPNHECRRDSYPGNRSKLQWYLHEKGLI